MCPLTCLIVFTVAGLLACHKHVAFHFAHEFQKIDVISSRLPRQTRATKLDQIFVIIFCHIMFPLTCVIVTSTLAHISVTRCISSNKISCRKQKWSSKADLFYETGKGLSVLRAVFFFFHVPLIVSIFQITNFYQYSFSKCVLFLAWLILALVDKSLTHSISFCQMRKVSENDIKESNVIVTCKPDLCF